jgi:hypothetical protein
MFKMKISNEDSGASFAFVSFRRSFVLAGWKPFAGAQ